MTKFQPFPNKEEYLKQMKHGALLNPRIDSTFKALFTQPTKESRAALKSFLEAATEHKIKTFTLLPTNAPIEFLDQRGVDYDILCEFDDDTHADIEMMAFAQNYDYGKRAEYHAARLETTYLNRGNGWEKASTVYQITVLDFSYDTENNNVVSRYAMRTKDGRELANQLNIIFIDLTKVKDLENSLDTTTALEKWAMFLKNADNSQKCDIIKKLTKSEAGLMEARKSLSNISADCDLWIAQYRAEMREWDRISDLDGMRRKGLQQGLQQGIQQQKAKDEKQINQLSKEIKTQAAENKRLQEEIKKLKSMLAKS